MMRRLCLSACALALLTGGALAAPAGADLIRAVQDGLDARAGALLKAHADPNARDATGATALAWAVMRGDDAMAAGLLKAKADPNAVDANGISPLMLAIANNAPGTVKLLLDAGADPNLSRRDHETPLMSAVRLGSLDMVRLLVAHKADVNARESQFGQTALMWAPGNPAITRILLDNGADIKPVTKSWDIASTDYTPTVTTLGVTGIPWNNDGDYSGKSGGNNALIFAAQKGDLESARMLLDAGMDVNFTTADGTTPLLAALYHWNLAAPLKAANGGVRGLAGGVTFQSDQAMANLLLDRGAKAVAADRAGYTPLHGAVLGMMTFDARGNVLIGFEPDKRGIPDAQPVPPANEAEGVKLVARLLALGADPNAATRNTTPGPLGAVKVNPAPPGSTPFHIAAHSHSAKLVELMAAHGADPNKLRKDGHTPFSVAVMSDDLPVVQAMVAHGADLKMIYNPRDKIADPVESKAEVRRNQTILHIAGISGAHFLIQFLADKGAPLKARNDHGETPLDLADAQERFRYGREGEVNLGRGNPDRVRETATSDAFKRALGLKVASK